MLGERICLGTLPSRLNLSTWQPPLTAMRFMRSASNRRTQRVFPTPILSQMQDLVGNEWNQWRNYKRATRIQQCRKLIRQRLSAAFKKFGSSDATRVHGAYAPVGMTQTMSRPSMFALHTLYNVQWRPKGVRREKLTPVGKVWMS